MSGERADDGFVRDIGSIPDPTWDASFVCPLCAADIELSGPVGEHCPPFTLAWVPFPKGGAGVVVDGDKREVARKEHRCDE